VAKRSIHLRLGRCLAVELPEGFLDDVVVDLELLDLLLDGRETVVVCFILEASLVLAMSKMLYLLATLLEEIESESSRGSLEEVAERGKRREVLGGAGVLVSDALYPLQFINVHCRVHLLKSVLRLFEEAVDNALTELSLFLIIVHL
jgi:hypothetical protein